MSRKSDDLPPADPTGKPGLAGGTSEHISSTSDIPFPRQSIPDHELLIRIGRGSYGEVWLARSALGRLRAVKIVQRSAFDSDRPYEREFAGIQRFEPVSRSHEGLVDILHVGRNDSAGFFYYVMELADSAEPSAAPAQEPGDGSQISNGQDLRMSADFFSQDPARYRPCTLSVAIHKHGRMHRRDILPAFLSITAALAHLHRQGLLHRDIKPANIIIVEGVAKLADIGLVTDIADADTWVGTEGFIPPEGPGRKQADVYALGKVLYEACTGRDRFEYPALPLDAGSADADADPDLLELNAIFLRACARDPGKRYLTADEMHADLALVRSGRSVKRHRALESNLAWARRVGLGAVAVAAILVGTVWLKSREVEKERRHRLEVETAYREANLARASAERRSGLAGAREASLASVAKAVAVGGRSAAARSEAIAALALTDLHEIGRWPALMQWMIPSCFNEDLTMLARVQTNGSILIGSIDGHRPSLVLPARPEDGGTPQLIGPFSRDGRWLFSVTRNGSYRVWNVENADVKLQLPPPREGYPAAFTHDSRALGVLNERGVLRLHDLLGGDSSELRLSSSIRTFAFSPAEPLWAAAVDNTSNQTEVIVSDINSTRVQWSVTLPAGARPEALNFSADGRWFAVSGSDYRVYLFRTSGTHTLARVLYGHSAPPVSVAIQPRGDFIASSAYDGSTRLWSLLTGDLRVLVQNPVINLRFSPDGTRLGYLESRTQCLVLAELSAGEVCPVAYESAPAGTRSPLQASFSSNGNWLATASFDGVRILETQTGALAATLGREPILSVAFSQDGRSLWAGGRRLLSRWPIQHEENGVLQIGISGEFPVPEIWHILPTRNDEKIVLVPGGERRIQVRLADGTFPRLTNSQYSWRASLSAHGQNLAVSRTGFPVQIWDLASGQITLTMPSHDDHGVAFNPRGQWIYTGAYGEVYQWDYARDRPGWVTTNPAPQGSYRDIACSPDGRLLAAAWNDLQIGLVDATTGNILAQLEHPERRQIQALIFSPDGSRLAAVCPSGCVQLWNLRRLRHELALRQLDWDHPAIPPAPAPTSAKIHVEIRAP